MAWPPVICNGVIRSGSTWSFNVCRLLAQIHASRRGEQYESGFVDGPALEKYLVGKAHLFGGTRVYKTHATGPVTLQWIRAGKAKAVCTYRDPRDCVASDVAFMNQGFDASVHRVAASVQAIENHRDFGRTLFVRYEDMMSDPAEHIRLIAAYLNIRVDHDTVNAIDQQTNLESSRKFCAQIPSMGYDIAPILADIARRRHNLTLLHDNHIGSAKSGRWKTDLTETQGRSLTQRFSSFLIAMGYETPRSIQASLLRPSVSAFQAIASPSISTRKIA